MKRRAPTATEWIGFGSSQVINGDTYYPYSGTAWDLQRKRNTPLIRCEARWGYSGLSSDDTYWINRTQFRSVKSMELGKDYWISVALYWRDGPSNSLTADKVHGGAWFALLATRHVEDPGDLQGQGGPWSLGLVGERPLIKTRYSAEDPMVHKPTETDQHLGDPLPRNKWVRYVWQLRFGENGLLRQWRDGVQELNLNLSMGYRDQYGPRLRGGIYRGHVNVRPTDTQIIYFDNLETVGDLSGRISNPLPAHSLA